MPTNGLHFLGERFEAARHLYNAVREEALRRARRRRESRRYHKARKTRDPERRNGRFAEVRADHRFRLYDLFPLVGELCHGDIGRHLDVCTAQGSAKRACDAVNDWVVGHRGRPRFKSARRGLRSVAGTEHSGIRIRGLPAAEDGVEIDLVQLEMRWKGLRVSVRFRYGWRPTRHGAGHRVKFVRLLRKVHGGQIRLYAQVVCAEQPLEGGAGDATGGWDLGVSTSAWVGDSCTALEPFAPGLADFRRRRALYALGRSCGCCATVGWDLGVSTSARVGESRAALQPGQGREAVGQSPRGHRCASAPRMCMCGAG